MLIKKFKDDFDKWFDKQNYNESCRQEFYQVGKYFMEAVDFRLECEYKKGFMAAVVGMITRNNTYLAAEVMKEHGFDEIEYEPLNNYKKEILAEFNITPKNKSC